jgi:hypothetical protein
MKPVDKALFFYVNHHNIWPIMETNAEVTLSASVLRDHFATHHDRVVSQFEHHVLDMLKAHDLDQPFRWTHVDVQQFASYDILLHYSKTSVMPIVLLGECMVRKS